MLLAFLRLAIENGANCMIEVLSQSFPEWLKKPVRLIKMANRYIACRLFYTGDQRYCPICNRYSRRFLDAGTIRRLEAKCPCCGSLERHRLAWLFFKKNTNLFSDDKIKFLHIAPEDCFKNRFQAMFRNNYITADLYGRKSKIKMDITCIQFPNDSFDVIYCSHVLEHVENDKQAMREFFRVLKKNGWAILNVPITDKNTFEDPSIVDPKERLKAFGQSDHVRRYGLDYADRLREAGFSVDVFRINDIVDDKDAETMKLFASGEIFYCTKPHG